MTPERPSSHSERLLRSTLERNPPQAYPRAHRRRHSHIVPSTSTASYTEDDDDELFRAAFLCRTAATASSPVRPHYPHHHSYSHHQRTSTPSPTRDYYSHDSRSRSRAASPSHLNRPSSPSPRSSRRQSLHRSPASADEPYRDMSSNLQRHNSTPARKRSAPTSSASVPTIESQLTPHEQVLRARLERVLITGKVVDDMEQSRERHHVHGRRGSRDESVPGWPWSDHSLLGSTPPKSTSSSDHGHGGQYLFTTGNSYQTHHRSRSKTDPLTPPPHLSPNPRRATAGSTTPAPSSPYLLPNTKSSSSYGVRQQYYRNNSGSSAWTPPLTADASPVLSEPHTHSLPGDVDVEGIDARLLLTPPPTPPLYGNTATTVTPAPASTATATPAGSTKRPPGVAMYRSRTRESTDYCSSSAAVSPYMYRRDMDGSVEQLSLPLPLPLPLSHSQTFNARKASERCRMMEGYVSFAQVEGLGTPPDGVDDDDVNNRDMDGDAKRQQVEEGKRGRGLIGTWARKLFVGVAAAQS